MNTILVTGASGLLASEFLKQLFCAEPAAHVIALSENCDVLEKRYSDMEGFSCYRWDEIDRIPFEAVSVVLHCAFARTEDGADLLRSLELTKLLLSKTAPLKIPFISISSRSVYGQNPKTPWSETTALSPENPYALAKAAQELLVCQAGEQGSFAYTNLRLAGLIGVGMDARLVAKLVKSAVDTGKITCVGGMQQFALLDIRDAAAGLHAILKIPTGSWKTVYNLGHSNVSTLDEIVSVVKHVAFQKYHTHIIVQKQNREVPLMDGMDCSCIYAATGWTPQYSMEDTVEILFDHYERT